MASGAPSKKRPKEQNEDDGAAHRKRGRPRLDLQTEKATERRRNQIRLAQRAYRMRKETTIDYLKVRTSKLEDAIQQMHQGFLTFHREVSDSTAGSWGPMLAELSETTLRRFHELSQVARPDSDHEGDDSGDYADKTSNHTVAQTQTARPAKRRRIELLNKQRTSTVGHDVKSADVVQILGTARGMTSSNLTDLETEQEKSLFPPTAPWMQLDRARQPSQQAYMQLSDISKAPDLFRSLAIPIERPLHVDGNYTYSFQETSFARRLHRSCLEVALQMLSSAAPDEDPSMRQRFRFTFCLTNRLTLAEEIRASLRRSLGESLETYAVPFLSVGGASFHYPERDQIGNPIYPQNVILAPPINGPLPLITAQTPRSFGNLEDLVEQLDFSGVWFDSHDVEGYLRDLGLEINPQASYVKVDYLTVERLKSPSPESLTIDNTGSSLDGSGSGSVDMSSPEDIYANTAGDLAFNYYFPQSNLPLALPQSSISKPSLVPDSMPLQIQQEPDLAIRDMPEDYFNIYPADGPSYPNLSGIPTSLAPDMELPIDTRSSPAQMSSISPPAAQPLQTYQPFLLDVDKLIKEVISHGICLGRAPGFRKGDVTSAVLESLVAPQEVY